tara:strand:+ start:151 stop:504 length:354 start_codon:yes stop_codon:yes gene_type:complete
MIKFYHNPRCGTCRKSLSFLHDNNQDVNLVEYLTNPISKIELKKIIKLLNISAYDLIRVKESLFKELYAGKRLSNDECIDILLKHPVLMERPIIVQDNKAIIGRPAIKVLDLLNCKI